MIEDMDKVREQFNSFPYYNAPLENSPKENYYSLYLHNIVTPFYRRDQKVISSVDKVILDAGCGSGYKSLILAEANPGAKIVGVDLSEKSVEIARDRLKFHGFSNVEFYAMAIEEVVSLDYQFDYINCDDVLYLLPDVLQGLKTFQSVLKAEGIIRANLHSKIARQTTFRLQKIWKRLGLMDNNPQEEECQIVRATMRNLKDRVLSKQICWADRYETSYELMFSNHLLLGDKGFTIPETFALLNQSDLEFISMVKWHQWDLLSLFQNIDELPIDLMFKLSEMEPEEQLHIHELFHSGERLLDFWCGHLQGDLPIISAEEWTDEQWQQAQVHLHPQLRTERVKAEAIAAIEGLKSINLNDYFTINPDSLPLLESTSLGLIFPLLDRPKSFLFLVQRWQTLHPIDPITEEIITAPKATQQVKEILTPLYEMGYLLLES